MANRPGMKVGEVEHTVINEMLEVGQQAPDFSLIANNMSARTLADYSDR